MNIYEQVTQLFNESLVKALSNEEMRGYVMAYIIADNEIEGYSHYTSQELIARIRQDQKDFIEGR